MEKSSGKQFFSDFSLESEMEVLLYGHRENGK